MSDTKSLHTELTIQKAALRRQIRELLASITKAQRIAASAKTCALLKSQILWKEAESILFFAPLPEELDVWPLLSEALEAGKVAALPFFSAVANSYVACQVKDLARDLKVGQFGIREPADRCEKLPLKRLDLILVPGVAFDLPGRRLGRGRGFYDRLLAAISGIRCGVAFDEQIVGELPAEPHDARVNCILTPTRWIKL